ncbi:MAG: NAD(P)H-dependent glycerol-3-phosphate dehydrogenase [Candidatus Babeliales bacterium]
MKVTVLGDGAWGTAIARLLAEKGYQVTLWCHNEEVANAICTTGYNALYFPHFLCDGIQVTTSLEQALANVTWIFQAIPVAHMRSVLEKAKPYYRAEQIWVMLSKGIEKETQLLPSFIMNSVFEHQVLTVVVSGPSYAHDLAQKKPTGVVVAATNHALAHTCAQMLATDYVCTQISSDVTGVQLCAALKNVIALGMGMLDGAGYTDNTKALLLTRGLYEIELLVKKMGGTSKTIYGLAGVGDLVLTSMGSLSKNVSVGKQFGSGQDREAIVSSKNGVMPEGINTVQSLYQLAREHRVEVPMCDAIHDVVMKGASVADLIQVLMA